METVVVLDEGVVLLAEEVEFGVHVEEHLVLGVVYLVVLFGDAGELFHI